MLVMAFSPKQLAQAQTATLNGFVTDESTGQVMEGATIALYRADVNDAAPVYGTATNEEGFYIIRNITPRTI